MARGCTLLSAVLLVCAAGAQAQKAAAIPEPQKAAPIPAPTEPSRSTSESARPAAPSQTAPPTPPNKPEDVAGIPVNYDESKVGTYTLPDPLVMS